MKTHTRPGAPCPTAIRGVAGALAATLATAAILLTGCGPTVTPTPEPSPAPTPTPALTQVAYADTLRIGFVPGALEAGYGMVGGFRALSGAEVTERARLQTTVLANLYRYDAREGVVPDLADGECRPPGDDPTILRCRLVETTWHDGTPVTAGDVAFVFGLAQRVGWFGDPAASRLKEVRVIDSRTVDFMLAAVDPAFISDALAGSSFIMLPRHAYEAAYADFVDRTKDLETGDLATLADTIDAELGRDPPICTTRLDEVRALLEQIGVTLYLEDYPQSGAGTTDTCTYMGLASGWVRLAADALKTGGLDAAAWSGLLSVNWHPVGAGPYRFVSEDADGIHLEAWPDYHGGPAATRYIDFLPTKADGSALVDGTLDILQGSEVFDAEFIAAAGSRGIATASHASPGYIALTFNVRPGRIFADRDLRLALQLCTDLERNVDAATGGTALPIYSPALAGSWADEPDVPRPDRDVAAAKELIEGAGWVVGADGVYARDGIRVAADIVVRATEGTSPRVKMADLIALQARDCGMDLRTHPAAFTAIEEELLAYPHRVPGTDEPFDLYIGGTGNGPDPAGPFSGFTSAQVSSEENSYGGNMGGFSDPAFDRLVETAAATYDRAERARLYREAQLELAAQLPILFLWSGGGVDAVRSAVATVDGPLDLTAPNWAWQPERMVVAAR